MCTQFNMIASPPNTPPDPWHLCIQVHVYQKTIKTLLAKLNALDANQQQELQKLRFDDEEKVRGRHGFGTLSAKIMHRAIVL